MDAETFRQLVASRDKAIEERNAARAEVERLRAQLEVALIAIEEEPVWAKQTAEAIRITLYLTRPVSP